MLRSIRRQRGAARALSPAQLGIRRRAIGRILHRLARRAEAAAVCDDAVVADRATGRAKRVYAYGGAQHRIVKTKPKSGPRTAKIVLPELHPAMIGATSLFPGTIVEADASPRLLVSGMNSRKTGRMVMKGRWRGCPIFTLTLVERATCPGECPQLASCYGNSMHLARRHAAGPELEARLVGELRALAVRYPAGFVVRLHILGDFYSVGYVRLWSAMLDELPPLLVFGYTARGLDTAIGAEVLRMTGRPDGRCWIRFSDMRLGPLGAVVIDDPAESRSLICPAQTGATDCCATCGLCWASPKTIEFLRH